MTVNKHPIERIYPDDKRVKPQTIAHHMARYKLASGIRYVTKGSMSLDLGSGTGYGAEMLRKAGYEACGVEINSRAIMFSRKNYPKVTFIHRSLDSLIWGESKFDVITFFEVIEHLGKSEAMRVLRKASSVLRDRGVFVLSIPRDINSKNNGFHKSNWTFNELKVCLEERFKLVQFLGQDWDTAEFSDRDVETNDFYIAICKND